MTEQEWELERAQHQDPRLRAFLDCLRLLDDVVESDYSILHCSPARLQDIWEKTRAISDLLTLEIASLLETSSRVPLLEEALRTAETVIRLLSKTTLTQLSRFPREIQTGQEREIRRLLCTVIGQLQSFLHDMFTQLLAADPRDLGDADDYLLRGFPQGVEEAEYLHATVCELRDQVEDLEKLYPSRFLEVAERIRNERAIPESEVWDQVSTLLEAISDRLIPKLKELLSMRGVRIDEMDLLNRYAVEISRACDVLGALYNVARQAIDQAVWTLGEHEATGGRHALATFQDVLSGRMVSLMTEINGHLLDLRAFLPLWLNGIERRRALRFSERLSKLSANSEGQSEAEE